MDLEDSGIDSDPKHHSDLDISTPNEPIITFSPDRCRFDTGKSRNSSITSDFELSNSLDVAYSAVVEPSEKSMTDLLTSSVAGSGGGGINSNSSTGGQTPQTVNNNINSKSQPRIRNNGSSTSNNSTNSTSLDLQKRLEKQIAQAAMATHANEQKSEEETEFGEWNTHQEPNLNHNNNNQNNQNTNTETEASSHNVSSPKAAGNKFQEFEVDEVEVITKCSRRMSTSAFDGRKQSGLIPPERLAIPHKGHSNSNRKHSKTTNPESKAQKKQITNIPNPPEGANPPGSTSENKPLVQWDSDESEEELSFFPAAKTRAKLTDNLSIDNMSLSGEEDDLHLSPPRHLTRKCPCDPRPWIQDHLPKTPAGGNAQCCIT